MIKEIPQLKNSLELYVESKKRGLHPISYSQAVEFLNCPYSWKLKKIDKIDKFDQSIHLIFGTAIHETIQNWLHVRFTKGEVEGSLINLGLELKKNLTNEYTKLRKEKDFKEFTTAKEMAEIYNDGVAILRELKANKDKYFPTKSYKLIGCEVPIIIESDINPKIAINGFIDVVIFNEETEEYVLYDIKTAKSGWFDNNKKDFNKIAQLLLYKHYFAKQFNVDVNKISVEFFILKKKLWAGSKYVQSRIQQFRPSCGKVNMNKMNILINNFIKYVFDENGNILTEKVYKKADKEKNCMWCLYKGSKYCDKFEYDKNNKFDKK